jgi:hypothetical protein
MSSRRAKLALPMTRLAIMRPATRHRDALASSDAFVERAERQLQVAGLRVAAEIVG